MIRLEEKIMDFPCEFCGIVRALVYCKSDAARLCLNCDGCVHNANPLARRHQRSLICDKCTLQPAIIRCVDEKLNLCQVCDCNGNGCSGLGHNRQAMDCYSGCPSMTELVRIWSVVFDPHCSSTFSPGWVMPNAPVPTATGLTDSLIPLNENHISNGLEQREFNELETCAHFEPWIGSSSVIPNCIPLDRDQVSFFPEEPHQLPKGCSDFKELEINNGHDICEGLSIEDVSLNFDNKNTMFGSAQATPIKYYKDLGIMEKNSSITESDGPMDNGLEVFSTPNLCFSRSSS